MEKAGRHWCPPAYADLGDQSVMLETARCAYETAFFQVFIINGLIPETS